MTKKYYLQILNADDTFTVPSFECWVYVRGFEGMIFKKRGEDGRAMQAKVFPELAPYFQ